MFAFILSSNSFNRFLYCTNNLLRSRG